MLLSQGKCPGLFFLPINIRRKIKTQKRNKWPLGVALVFPEIRHIKTNPKNGGVLIDEERFCVAGGGATGFGERMEL